MKIKCLCLILITLILASTMHGCVPSRSKNGSDFFFWMDGYVAVPIDSNLKIALTYYYKKNSKPIDINNISSMEFVGLNDVNIETFTINQMEFGANAKYNGYSFELDLNFPQKGIFTTEHLILHFNNATESVFPIGNWIFDVGEQEQNDPAIDTWNSPSASSDNSKFVYEYKLNDSAAIITELSYGNQMKIYSENGIALIDSLELEGDAPVKYIKTKMIVKINDIYTIVYGKGCYCGSLDIDNIDVEASAIYSIDNVLD